MTYRWRASLQILGSLVIWGWVPGNYLKTTLLILLWALTWGPVHKGGLVLFFLCAVVFTVMDVLAVSRGVFTFSHPDFWGLPVWEMLNWAFITYHFHHMIQGPTPRWDVRVVPLVILFSACFGIFLTHLPLLISTGIVLAAALFFFHDPEDLSYAGYAIAVGTAMEYMGVARGLWHYPGAPPGGVPFWYITMWGGIGLFTRRLLLPLQVRVFA